jgi:PhnB protein
MSEKVALHQGRTNMSGVPDGYHNITPQLVLKDASAAIELYNRVFGAVEIVRILAPGSNNIFHACITIGDSRLFLVDEIATARSAPKDGAVGARFYLYVTDVDARHKVATAAGMKEVAAPEDMPWGDRMSIVFDRHGQEWSLASPIRK